MLLFNNNKPLPPCSTVFIMTIKKIKNVFVFSVMFAVQNLSYKITKAAIACPNNCKKTYKTISNLNKHLKYECNKLPQQKCLFCDKLYKRPDNLKKHVLIVHGQWQ